MIGRQRVCIRSQCFFVLLQDLVEEEGLLGVFAEAGRRFAAVARDPVAGVVRPREGLQVDTPVVGFDQPAVDRDRRAGFRRPVVRGRDVAGVVDDRAARGRRAADDVDRAADGRVAWDVADVAGQDLAAVRAADRTVAEAVAQVLEFLRRNSANLQPDR